ncbi:GntR family transcriptional regulator [Actinomyces minihominis]|uniref:GntR family transcriptional regulator n=1 Tax=Actinomyces minihominis TaxID=2002838 RepID=UPI000C06FDB6|nr:GntR family transcriptional regulator [Actinomyces minihominis]
MEAELEPGKPRKKKATSGTKKRPKAARPKPKDSISKAETAYLWIKERILSHQYGPGYRLVLASIAGELDMSVVPVREAIRRLEADGLVTFERNVGACVKMYDDTQYAHSMETLAIIEGAATALSAPNLTRNQIEKARRVNDLMRDTLDEFNARLFTVLNQEFHAALLLGCPNDRLTDLVHAEWAMLGNLRESTFAFVPNRAKESVREHSVILELIENGAPSAAIENAVRTHRTATMDAYLIREHEDAETPAPSPI